MPSAHALLATTAAVVAWTVPVSRSLPLPAVIALGAEASATEAFAARTLAQHLRLPTRAPLAAREHPAPQIAVGYDASRAIGASASRLTGLAAKGGDAFCLLSAAGGVGAGSVAVGAAANSTRGAMNGAFELLRRLGFEFLAPDETVAPPFPLRLPWAELDHTHSPPFESRDMETMETMQGKGWPVYHPTNLSAALGFNGRYAHGPVGRVEAPSFPPGFGKCSSSLAHSFEA